MLVSWSVGRSVGQLVGWSVSWSVHHLVYPHYGIDEATDKKNPLIDLPRSIMLVLFSIRCQRQRQ